MRGMKTTTKIGVVIVHFGNKKDTLECLRALEKTAKENVSLIIYLVDNDPENRILNKDLRGFSLKIYRLEMNRNLGFGAGMNKGCQRGLKDQCRFMLLLNNDVVICKDSFKILLPYFKHKNVGVVSPLLVYYDNPKKIWCTNGKLNKTFLYTTYPHMDKFLQKVSLPDSIESDFSGACLLVDSKVFRKTGFFDERYFLYVEDVEWCLRVREADFKIIFVTQASVLHKVSAAAGVKGTNILSSQNAYFYARNFFILLRDHAKSFSVIYAIFGQTFIRFPFYALFRIRSFRGIISYLQGYIDGWSYLLTGKLTGRKLI